MSTNAVLKAAAFIFVVALVSLLYWVTLEEEPLDPCASPQGDISAAVLAGESGDQDALVNRAILVRGECEQPQD